MRILLVLFISLLLVGCVTTKSTFDRRGISGHLLSDTTTEKVYMAEWVHGDIYWLHEVLPYDNGVLYYKGE